MTLKVGKIEITSDQAKTNAEFAALVDMLTGRLKALVALDIQLETGQAATPQTAPGQTSSSAIQTVAAV